LDVNGCGRFTGALTAGTISGTTIYGNTAVCSAVGKFTTCIDAGSGTFSSSVTATQLSVNTTNTTGKINIQGPNDSGLLYLFNSCANARFMFNNYYGYGIDAMIIQEFNTSNVLQRDIISFAAGGKVGIGTALPTTALEVSSTDLNNIFVTNPTTTGTTTGSGIGFKAYNGTSVAQSAGIILTSNTWSYGTYSANQLSIGADGTGGIALRTACSAPISFFTGCTTAGLSAERMRLCSNGFAYFACELTAKTIGTNDLLLNNLNYECANYVDGTRGSWLIQEGACDLFIINQMSCKKYKFNLIEIK
jgi:hypothetical protein